MEKVEISLCYINSCNRTGQFENPVAGLIVLTCNILLNIFKWSALTLSRISPYNNKMDTATKTLLYNNNNNVTTH